MPNLNRFKRSDKQAGLDSRTERLLCTGLVVSARVCREIAPLYKPDLLIADFTRWVADTCLEFHAAHGAPPGRHIEDVFSLAQREGMDGTLAALISEFLGGISTEYERADKFNEGYVVDQSIRYFRGRALRTAASDAQVLLQAGRLEDAEARWGAYVKVERPVGEGVNPFTDKDLMRRAFERHKTPLFTVPGAAGKLLSVQLHRKNFISWRAPAKRTKSFTLQELAKRAAAARCNVALIGVGDMSEEEYAWRWAVNLAGRSDDPEDCAAGWIPCLDCALNQDNTCKRSVRVGRLGLAQELREAKRPHPDDTPKGYKPCAACWREPKFQGASWWEWRQEVEPLTWSGGLRAGEQFMRRLKGRDFKLLTYASKEFTPNGLEGLLSRWRDYEGWLPDVLIVDYLDEMGSDAKFEQYRHQEAAKWSACRGIAKKWNLLFITADQGDTASYTAETIGMKNFNEDRRRNDVLTGGIGINQTPDEEYRGLVRWSWAFLRKGHYKPGNQVCVVQSLSQGRPLVGSWWRRW